jgi:hypothetical protein
MMKVNWDVVVGSVISGVVVATFSYYFLSKSEISSSVSLEYHYGNIGAELVELADAFVQGSIKESINRSRRLEPMEDSVKFDVLAADVSNLSLSVSEISRFSAVENLVVTNNDQSREAVLRVRGLDTSVVAWASKTTGLTIKRGAFEEKVVLQPSEKIEIRNYALSPNSWLQDGSKDVLVFVDDVLMVAENRKTTLDYMFGPYMKAYPFIFMVSIISGAIFLALLIFNGLMSVVRPKREVLVPQPPATEDREP